MKAKNGMIRVAVAMVAVLLSVQIATAGTVTGEDTLSVQPVIGTKKAMLSVANVDSDQWQLHITDQRGNAIGRFSFVDKESFNTVFDFSRLREGTYSVVLKNGKAIVQEKAFVVSGEDLYVGSRFKSSAPFVNYNNDKLNIAYVNNGEQQVKLKVLDTNGKVVYKQAVGEDKYLNKQMDLASLTEGNYTVVVSSGLKRFRTALNVTK